MMGLFFLLIPLASCFLYRVCSQNQQHQQEQNIELGNMAQQTDRQIINQETTQVIIPTEQNEEEIALEREITRLEKKKKIAQLKREIQDLEVGETIALEEVDVVASSHSPYISLPEYSEF